jgi:hypothetical protein
VLRFLRRSRVLTGALIADLNATVLAMPIALFPAINAERFGGSPSTLGLLATAIAVGAILGSGLSGPIGRLPPGPRHAGRRRRVGRRADRRADADLRPVPVGGGGHRLAGRGIT